MEGPSIMAKVTAVSASHGPAEQFRIPQPRPGFAALVIRWFRSQLTNQPPTSAAVLPDDARKQLQHDLLYAQRRIERLSMTIRLPL